MEDAAHFLDDYAETRAYFAKVADLVAGFESSFGLELLSTVHWIMREQVPASADEIVERTYAWNDRKRQFMPRQVAVAVDVLRRRGMIDTSSPGAN